MTDPRPAALLALDQHLGLIWGAAAPPPPTPQLWEALDRLALEAELHALLRRSAQLAGRQPPPLMAAAWRRRAWQDEGRGLLMRAETGRALDVLAAAGIQAMLLKGAALCPVLYGDWSLRPLGDLDLLVREEAAVLALRTLLAAGYRLVLGHDELVEGRRGPDLEALTAYHAQVTLLSPSHVVLDLHWHLFDRPAYRHGLPMGPFWDRALPLEVEGRVAWRLNDADQLLHLAAHPFIHHPEWRGLEGRWRQDVAAWLRRDPGLDGGALVLRARDCGLLEPLRRALLDLPAWCDPPPGLQEALAAARAGAVETAAWAWLSAPRPGLGQKAVDQLRHLPSWRLRLRYLARKFMPSPAYLRRRYGWPQARGLVLASLYLRRWGRLLRLVPPSPPPRAPGVDSARSEV